MKAIVSLVLALGILAQSVCATDIPQGAPLEINPPPHDNSLPLAVLLVTAMVFGSCIVFYAYRENADPWEAHVFVLQRDHYDANWQDIATRTIALSPSKAKALFADAIQKDGGGEVARYRVKDLGPVQ